MSQRPLNQTEYDCFMYLHTLRDSGVVNMFGATPYLVRDMDIDQPTARRILSLWMAHFNEQCKYDHLMVDA